MPRQGPQGRTNEDFGDAEVVTPSDLITQYVSVDSTRPVARGRRVLQLRGLPVATVGADPASVTPMCAISARDMPVVDTLAAVAAQDPSGVLLIETRDAAFAFEVKHGRIIGARGTGPRGQLEPWVAEVHRRHPERFAAAGANADTPAWLEVARAFVEEHVLDQLALCREAGARLTLARGDIEWVGTRIPETIAPTLRHLLLEHARRYDEEPRILASLGSFDRIAVPMREPGTRPVLAARKPSSSDAEWDFFDDPDPAALAEWDDAVRIWSLCDGQSTIGEIVDDALLGRFRCLLALQTLVKSQHVVLVDPSKRTRLPSGEYALAAVIQMPRAHEIHDDEDDVAATTADPATSSAERPIVALAPEDMIASDPDMIASDPDTIASDPDWEENSTAYSFVLRTPKPRRRALGRTTTKAMMKVLDPIDAAMAEVLAETELLAEVESSEATKRERLLDIDAADTRREAVLELDAPADTRREQVIDPCTAPIDLAAERDAVAESTTTKASASRSVGQALDRALPSPRVVTVALALTGAIAMGAAVIAILV
jgi:hypothetical protein